MISAQMLLAIFILTFSSFLPSSWCHTHNRQDRMGWSDKLRLIDIAGECMQDAQMKIRTISDIRDRHYGRMSFDIGVIMGNIREKYRRMIEEYREFRDKHSGRSTFYPPAYRHHFYVVYYVIGLNLLHTQEVDIDRLIRVLENINNEIFNPDPRYVGRRTTRRRQQLRAGDYEIINKMAAEQDLKSSYREQHLLRKLNLPAAQHTTAKRFQQQWPVDDNWQLGAYGDMGLYGGH